MTPFAVPWWAAVLIWLAGAAVFAAIVLPLIHVALRSVDRGTHLGWADVRADVDEPYRREADQAIALTHPSDDESYGYDDGVYL